MFYLLLMIYLLPLGFILYWLVRFAIWLIKKTVKLAYWLVCKTLVLLGRVLRWAFTSLWRFIRTRQTMAESTGA